MSCLRSPLNMNSSSSPTLALRLSSNLLLQKPLMTKTQRYARVIRPPGKTATMSARSSRSHPCRGCVSCEGQRQKMS